MKNDELEPAASEPSSIAPMALDVHRWEIDLRNLRSGERLDLAVPERSASDSADDLVCLPPQAAGLPSRAGRRVLGVMTAVVVIAGLGVAGFMAKPSLQRALASSGSRSSRTTTVAAPVVPAAPPVVALPVVVAPVVAVAPAAPVAPVAPAAAAVAGTPTFSLDALPNAPAKKKQPKRAPSKRGK